MPVKDKFKNILTFARKTGKLATIKFANYLQSVLKSIRQQP